MSYTELRAMALAAVDEAFAETVRLSFLKSGAADPARPARDIQAVLRVGEGKISNIAGGSGSTWRTRLIADKAELHINRTTYAGPVIAVGDRVRATSRPGSPWFEVGGIDDRGDTRLVLQLNEV